MPSTTALLDRLLDPVGNALTPEAARRLVDELAERANQGTLTQEERSEYEALIAAGTVIGVLQAKARAVLAAHASA